MKVSGLDVHKDSIFCAIYDGKSYSEVKEYDSTTNSGGIKLCLTYPFITASGLNSTFIFTKSF